LLYCNPAILRYCGTVCSYLCQVEKLRNDELGRVELKDLHELERLPLDIVLDNVRSALNTGSVFRTCDAFRIGNLHLCGITATPPHKEIQKTALGSTESVPWNYWNSTIEAVVALKAKGYKVYAAEQVRGSTPLQEFEITDTKIAVVFGHEMDGVSQEVVNQCDGTIEIPQEGMKHSLNISVSAGIVCWEFWKKLKEMKNG